MWTIGKWGRAGEGSAAQKTTTGTRCNNAGGLWKERVQLFNPLAAFMIIRACPVATGSVTVVGAKIRHNPESNNRHGQKPKPEPWMQL